MSEDQERAARILYHSSTGNTLACVEAAAEGLAECGYAVDIVRFDRAGQEFAGGVELIGLAAPTFQWHPPFHVRDFLTGLPDLAGKKVFVLVTAGGKPENTEHLMATPAVAAGAAYLGGAVFMGEDSYPHLRRIGKNSHPSHPTKETLDEARAFGKRIGESALNGTPPAPVPEFRWTFLTGLGRITTRSMMRGAMGKKGIDQELCIRCGKCADECPVHAITIDPPSFTDDCIGCCGCFNTCPTGALTASLLKKCPRYPGPVWLRRE